MSQTSVTVKETINVRFDKPKKFKVVLHNDDKTPMAFVIELLVGLFNHDTARAENITMEVHTNGKGVAGIYYYEIAEQKALEATNISRNNGFPLTFTVEEE
jgi:ATP-dependent Clp protease adaptor protein ClpS